VPNDFPPGGETTPDTRGRRLESWKEIAAYLGREVTTAQRWEKREGLPVRRLPHARSGSVSAYTSELDAWREARERGVPGNAAVENSTAHVQRGTDASTTEPASSRLEDTGGVHGAEHETPESRPLIRRPIRLSWLAAAVGVVTIVTAVWYRPTPAAAPLDSLAILPFANTNGDADLDYVSDGIAEALINALSAIEGLRVVPRTTAFRFRGRDADTDVRDLGRQLQVKAVVTGRVAQRGDALLVQVDLTDATSNAQIWGAQYQRAMADLLSLQQDIAQEVASGMQLRLRREEAARLARAPTEDREAYLLYLKGVHHFHKASLKNLDKALEHFTSAIARDPNFALAHAWLGATYFRRQQSWGVASAVEGMALARAAVERALALDDELAEAYVIRGRIRLSFDWDVAAAERDIRHALELDRRSLLAHEALVMWLRTQRRVDDTLATIHRMLALDPLSMWFNTELAYHFLTVGRPAEALTQIQRTLELDSSYLPAGLILRMALRASGRADEGILQWIDELRRNGDHDRADLVQQAFAEGGAQQVVLAERDRLLAFARTADVPQHMRIAYAAANAGDVDGAIEHLQRAYELRWTDLAMMHVNLRLASLWDDPRFIDLVRRVGVDPLARR
jgi:TolB-like protein